MLDQAEGAEEFYDNTLMPYKGKLEEWYVSNQSLTLYFALIIATIFTLNFGQIPFRDSLFAEIPISPPDLKEFF